MLSVITHRSVRPFALAIAATFLTGCAPDVPTATGIDASAVSARRTAPGPTSTNLGALPGDNSSRANGVNDAGEVVGFSCCSVGNRAFVRLSGVLTALAGENANALAISNGSPRYVVGWVGAPSQAVRWTVSGEVADVPVQLALGDATFGAARGVNDAGQAVGNAGTQAAVWDAAGNLTIVAAPEGFTRGEGRAINNSGDAVLVFSRSDPNWPNGIAIGYVRLASGALIALPSLTVGGISYANDLTATSGSTVQVAGSSYSSASAPRAVRWTVDVVQQAIVNVETRSEASHAVGISDAGVAAGFTEGQSHSLRTTAVRWQGSELLSLGVPKGAKEGKAWGMSASGNFITGEAIVQLSRTAILWNNSAP